MKKRRVKVKVNPYLVVSDALDSAIVSAMNKTDKYAPEPLTESQRASIAQHLTSYFWLALDEAGVEIK